MFTSDTVCWSVAVDVHAQMDPIFENNIKPMLEKIRDMKTTVSDTQGG